MSILSEVFYEFIILLHKSRFAYLPSDDVQAFKHVIGQLPLTFIDKFVQFHTYLKSRYITQSERFGVNSNTIVLFLDVKT